MGRILILCTGNSARSQMAEALLRSYDDRLEVFSAGTEPAAEVHPQAVRAMDEIGMDISHARPKSVFGFLNDPLDYVITVCDQADATCPVFQGRVRRRLHIPFPDPAAVRGSDDQVLEAFRRVRDQIGVRFREFYLEHVRAAAPRLRGARPTDLESVRQLLASCGLGAEGLEYAFPGGYVVVESAGELLGAAGLEVYGEDGLLRSVAVARGQRGAGLGALLVRNRLEWAANRGLRGVYLLTTNAADFFGWMGFRRIERDATPESIREQFVTVCPATAVLMFLQLT